MKVTNEIKIGILVTIVLVGLLALTFRIGNFNIGQSGYEIKVTLFNIDGVELNAPVRFNGLEVGAVKDIEMKYGERTQMELTLWIQEGVKVREGAKVSVKNMGLMGEKYIGIVSGEQQGAYLKPGALLVGQEPVDFEKLLGKGDEIAENLKEISINVNERLKVNKEAIDQIVANINVASKNIAQISENVNERLVVNKTAIDGIVANLNTTSQNLEELSEDLKLNPWKLLYKEKSKAVSAKTSDKK